jgi:hypothetical protein
MASAALAHERRMIRTLTLLTYRENSAEPAFPPAWVGEEQ